MPTRVSAKPAVSAAVLVLAAVALPGCAAGDCDPGRLRLGYFPNVTHAQALYGVQSGLFQEHLGSAVLEPVAFSAGPEAYEALLSGSVDAIYVGPSPTLNALDKTGSDVVRIVAGAASGGAGLVTRPGLPLDAASLAGLSFATPGIGNTQDIALRHWLASHGHEAEDRGGDIEVRNADGADILSMFKSGQLDAAWVPEPWVTRIVREAGGELRVDEASLWNATGGRYVTTHVVTTARCLGQARETLRDFLAGHEEATRRLQQGDPDVLGAVNDGIQAVTGKRLDDETLRQSMARVQFGTDPARASMAELAQRTRDIGFIRSLPDLDRAFDLTLLEDATQGPEAA